MVTFFIEHRVLVPHGVWIRHCNDKFASFNPCLAALERYRGAFDDMEFRIVILPPSLVRAQEKDDRVKRRNKKDPPW